MFVQKYCQLTAWTISSSVCQIPIQLQSEVVIPNAHDIQTRQMLPRG